MMSTYREGKKEEIYNNQSTQEYGNFRVLIIHYFLVLTDNEWSHPLLTELQLLFLEKISADVEVTHS